MPQLPPLNECKRTPLGVVLDSSSDEGMLFEFLWFAGTVLQEARFYYEKEAIDARNSLTSVFRLNEIAAAEKRAQRARVGNGESREQGRA